MPVGVRSGPTQAPAVQLEAQRLDQMQMMSALKRSRFPVQDLWPRFERNKDRTVRRVSRWSRIPESPSLFFAGMAGSRMPIVVSHGEGRARIDSAAQQESALVAMRYLDNVGNPTEVYPYNPNGSPAGITGALTTADGRFTVMMPHQKRVFRTVQMSWHPADLGEAFVDARCSATRGSGSGNQDVNKSEIGKTGAEAPVF